MQPCENPKCDNKEATPVVKFGSVVFYICEKCGYQFSIGRHGFATKKEIKKLQQDQFNQIIVKEKYEPVNLKRVFNKIGFEPAGKNIKLYHPMFDRNCKEPGVIREQVG